MTKKNKVKTSEIPLNAYIARAGISSRRKAIELIQQGNVMVNNELITEPGYKVKKDDVVKFKDKIIRLEKKVYILLNKPKGYVTTVSDEMERRTVMELVKNAAKERLYPVGRLDRDTTGLLVITNDGYLSQKLSHPRNKIPKTYYVTIDKPLDVLDEQSLKKGVYLYDGKASVDKLDFLKGRNRQHILVEIHGGKNRIVKRMFGHLGYRVKALDRINYSGLTKKGLPVSNWRYLTDDEIEMLQGYK